jgi:hypothetical protein
VPIPVVKTNIASITVKFSWLISWCFALI